MCAARAADGQDAFFLGVDVEKPLALQNGGVEADRAVHAGFLVDGKQAFKPRVREVLRVQNRQCHRNGNAVVAAERIKSPSTSSSSPSVRKLMGLSGVFSATMSRCPCTITVGAAS